jgi:hypothetical protein
VIRPTTLIPVLWAHRSHAGRYWAEFVARIQERIGPTLEVVVGSDPLTSDLTIVDTPPFDYAAADGSVAAAEILSLSDLCVFVVTPSRYADAASWSFLRRAARRGIPILFVLNRLTDDAGAEIALDYARHLFDEGFLLAPDPSSLFTISERVVEAGHEGLPAAAVAALRKELGQLSDPAFRQELVGQTSVAAVKSLEERVRAIANATEAEASAGRRLVAAVDVAYAAELAVLKESLAAGEYSWMADSELWDEVVTDFMGIVTRHVGDGAQQAAAEWEKDSVGRVLLESGHGHGLWRHGHDAPTTAQAVLQALLGDLEHLAASRTAKGKLRRRRREKRSHLIWRAVLDPGSEPPRRLRRAYRDGITALLNDARGLFERAFELVLDQDAHRFKHMVEPAARMVGIPATLERQVNELLADDTPVVESGGEEDPDE